MNPQKLRQLDYVEHMLDAIRLVKGYVEGMSRVDFLADRKTQQAVILNILVIGEAATKIGNEYQDWADQYPNVPWRQMRGMRNRMAHGYFEIDLDVVWETVEQSMPVLERELLVIQNQK